jgi:hydroxyacylglutathione hydrolase
MAAAQLHVYTIATPSLGDRSYVVTDGTHAIVIDPQRDIDRVLDIVTAHNLTVTHVCETHVHNDYVTGGYTLAHELDATYVLSADDEMFFSFHGVHDGDTFTSGRLTVTVMHTPGHTPTHLSYVVTDGNEQVVFTGGSLLYGSVGRTDLISRARAEELTRLQHASAQRLATLPDATTVFPTHGFGSFCSSAAADETMAHTDPKYGVEISTIGEQKQQNIALITADTDTLVALILGGLDAYPRYYVHMAPRNRTGPAPVNLTPPAEIQPAALARRMNDGEWVVDLRDRTVYANDHVTGTVNVEIGNSFTTYLAWIIPWGTPVTLIGDTRADVEEAQRQLVRVGIDRPVAIATGGVDSYGDGLPRGTYRVATFADYVTERAANPDITLLDVRRHDERKTAAVPNSVHIPMHELDRRITELSDNQPIWVHCASGFRASIAASLITRMGRTVVLIDDNDSRMPSH